MKLTQVQFAELETFFKAVDQKRLLFGPNDHESFFLHGIMEGMRESLELIGFTAPGITGLWWYEELSGRRQPGSIDLVKSLSEDDARRKHFIDGHTAGLKKVFTELNMPFK
jgi:hypothetical protein